MDELVNIQAHAAEILTINYSPPMRCSTVAASGDSDSPSDSTSLWTADTSYGQPLYSRENELVPPLILLVTAGRDRLIHVFEVKLAHGSKEATYNIIHTLDNHSSSVTTVRFTSDGQRLLSCGGDR